MLVNILQSNILKQNTISVFIFYKFSLQLCLISTRYIFKTPNLQTFNLTIVLSECEIIFWQTDASKLTQLFKEIKSRTNDYIE